MVYWFCFGSSYFPFSSQRIPHASLYFFLNSNRSVMFQTIKEEKIKKKHDKKIIKPLIGEVVERERERFRKGMAVLYSRQSFGIQNSHRLTAPIFQKDKGTICIFLGDCPVQHRFTFIIHCIWISSSQQ